MMYNELLPIGSVVLLKNAFKKIVIIGMMQIKHTESGEDIAYDYMGVPYPEGYIGPESAMLFNHDNIQEVFFKGYSNDERTAMIDMIQKIVDKAKETVDDNNQ